MKKVISLYLIIFFSLLLIASSKDNKNYSDQGETAMNIYDISVKDINGKEVPLSIYKGKVLLIVNVASECGYTPQYNGLQKLYEKYNESGFEILAFPCNQFGGQEPGSNEQIKEFCTSTFGVTFPLFDKIDVNGANRAELYNKLCNAESIETGDVKWNFEKFLISKEGNVVARYRSKVEPMSNEIVEAVEKELKK